MIIAQIALDPEFSKDSYEQVPVEERQLEEGLHILKFAGVTFQILVKADDSLSLMAFNQPKWNRALAHATFDGNDVNMKKLEIPCKLEADIYEGLYMYILNPNSASNLYIKRVKRLKKLKSLEEYYDIPSIDEVLQK